jgi:hypothetical protein
MQFPIVVLLAAGIVGSACASTPRTRAFQDVPRYLDTGDRIQVHSTDGISTAGSLGGLTPTTLTIWVAGTQLDFPDASIRAIDKTERRTARGAVVGLLVGGIVAIIAGRTQEPSGSPLIDAQAAGLELGAGLLFGAGVGALIGALTKVDRPIYQAPPPTGASAPAASRRGSP